MITNEFQLIVAIFVIFIGFAIVAFVADKKDEEEEFYDRTVNKKCGRKIWED